MKSNKIKYAFVVFVSVFMLFGMSQTGPSHLIAAEDDPPAGECGAGLGKDFKCAVNYALSLLEKTIPVLIGIAVVLFLFGMIKFIMAGGDEAKIKEGKQFMLWGIVGLFVMVSVWGLVKILVNSFFPSGGFYVPQVKGS